ncbi:MAG: four helix bundle protein [Ignavibacteria bacterium]|nr:four helix bundle protein [Ignavibacteria bacterium]
MSKIEKFEDLICLAKSRIVVKEIYESTSNGFFSKDYGLSDQIRRSSVSIMLNIAEGFGRKSHKEFKQFLYFSHGSVAEVQSALYIALDAKYLTEDVFENLYNKCTEISKIISGLIKSLN